MTVVIGIDPHKASHTATASLLPEARQAARGCQGVSDGGRQPMVRAPLPESRQGRSPPVVCGIGALSTSGLQKLSEMIGARRQLPVSPLLR